MKPPCKDCAKREIGCHAVCESYIKFNQQQEQIRHERYLKRIQGEIHDDQLFPRGNNAMKRFLRKMKDAKNNYD